MSKKLTHEEFLRRLKDNGITDIVPMEEYRGIDTKIKFKCLKHDYIWETTPYHILKGGGCPLCGIEKTAKARRKTHEQFLLEMKEKGNPNVIILGKYKTMDTKILCKCKICGEEWETIPRHLLDMKVGCPYCAGKRVNKNNSFSSMHPELVRFLKNKEDGDKYVGGSFKKVLTKCPDCGYESEKTIHSLHKFGYHCKVCGDTISFPNKFLRNLLKDETVEKQIQNLIFEWYPNWDKKCLFDAYFEKDDKRYVVEMQGNQHKTGKWGKKKTNIKEKDEYKRIETKKNGIIEIEVECYTATFDYIKEKVLNSELANILNFEKVDWNKIKENIYNNIIKQVCEEYNKQSDIIGWSDLSKKFNLSKSAIYNYLKIGSKNGWCNYEPNDSNKKILKLSNYIYELYDKDGNKILEEVGISKIAKRIKEDLKLEGFGKTSILKMVYNNKEKQGYKIIRKDNPNKHIY